jgi:hypothetical protein
MYDAACNACRARFAQWREFVADRARARLLERRRAETWNKVSSWLGELRQQQVG